MRIDLGKGIFAIIDDEDWEKVKDIPWRAQKGRNGKYYATARIFLHKVVVNAREGEKVDHISREPLDCRKRNLRRASHQQNAWNTGPLVRPGRSHPYKGVVLDRRKNKYKVAIIHCGVRYQFGYFALPEEAAAAYNEAAANLRGEWGYLNPVPPNPAAAEKARAALKKYGVWRENPPLPSDCRVAEIASEAL